MEKTRQKKGRPLLKEKKRTIKIVGSFNPEEYQTIQNLVKELGMTQTEVVRWRLLGNASDIAINAKKMIVLLDGIGLETKRTGDRIDQLARQADILSKANELSEATVLAFIQLLKQYTIRQNELQQTIRSVIRKMGR